MSYLRTDDCPICGMPAEVTCRCPRRDSECGNGHRWHWCLRCRVKVALPGLHSVTGCSCVRKDESHPLLGEPE